MGRERDRAIAKCRAQGRRAQELSVRAELPQRPLGVPHVLESHLETRLGAAQVAPTSTMLGVTRLAVPGQLVELESTAVG